MASGDGNNTAGKTSEKLIHTVLVIDGDEETAKSITSFLKDIEITPVFANTGEKAVEKIEKAASPFSIIIADQYLEGMKGVVVLEQAKKQCPDTIRILMSRDHEMEHILCAVNNSAVIRYITKPLISEDVLEAVQSGITLFEESLENERRYTIAKQQNAKLFDLNCVLMETTKGYSTDIHTIDNDIEILKKGIRASSGKALSGPGALLDEIETAIKADQDFDSKKAELFFSDVILTLYQNFKEVAHQNGFEIPDVEDKSP